MTKQLINVYGHNLKVGDSLFDVSERVVKVIKEIDSLTLINNNQDWINLVITFVDGTTSTNIFDTSKVYILIDIEEIIKKSNL